MGSGRRYASLVATQLAKALLDPAATAALAELDAVLLGGGPAPRPVLEGDPGVRRGPGGAHVRLQRDLRGLRV